VLDMTSHQLHLVLDRRRWPALRRIATAGSLVALELADDGKLSRLAATDCPTLHELIAQLPPEMLTEIVVRDVAVGHREALTRFARSQIGLVRFELNGVVQ
jgi:hypothetical protein